MTLCEFCTRHGEGKKWYENIKNYTEEVFHQVNDAENLTGSTGLVNALHFLYQTDRGFHCGEELQLFTPDGIDPSMLENVVLVARLTFWNALFRLKNVMYITE